MNYWSHVLSCINWDKNQCVPGCKSDCFCKISREKCNCNLNDGDNFDEYYAVGKRNDIYPLSIISFTESKIYLKKIFFHSI